jgi:hypothetical protein
MFEILILSNLDLDSGPIVFKLPNSGIPFSLNRNKLYARIFAVLIMLQRYEKLI